jgi:hypothetical protein
VQHDLAVLPQETEVNGAGRPVEAAGKWGLGGGASPAVSSAWECLFPSLSIPPREAEEGASISIIGLQPTASSVRSCLAPASGSSSCLALYERFFFGDLVRMASALYGIYDKEPLMEHVRRFLAREDVDTR